MKYFNKLLCCLMGIFLIVSAIVPETLKIHSICFRDILLFLIILIYLLQVILYSKSRKKFIEGIKDFFLDKLTLSMFILATIMALSTIYAQEKSLSLSETARFSSYIILFFIVKYGIYFGKFKEALLKIVIGTSAIISIGGIYQHYTAFMLNRKFVSSFQFGDSTRIATTFSNPNSYAAFLVIIILPVTMLLIEEEKLVNKIIYFVIFCLILSNIIFTYSRSSWLGLLFGIVILMIIYSKKLIAFLGGFIVIGIFVPQINLRLKNLLDVSFNESRIKLWKTAIKMFKEHFVLGVGNGNFISRYNEYILKYPKLNDGLNRFPTHNSYLKILSELGIIGMVAFAFLLVLIILRLIKYISICKNGFLSSFYKGFLATILAIYFMNMFDNLFFVPQIILFFWIIFAISQSYLYEYKIGNNYGN